MTTEAKLREIARGWIESQQAIEREQEYAPVTQSAALVAQALLDALGVVKAAEAWAAPVEQRMSQKYHMEQIVIPRVNALKQTLADFRAKYPTEVAEGG